MADLYADVPGVSRPVPTGLFIAGEWRPSSSGATFDVHDPADAGVLAQVADATQDDTAAAMDAAYAALPEWSATPPRKRSEILRRAFEAMHARADDLALLMVRENGKALTDAKAELTYAAEFFRWFSEEAVRIDGDYRIAPAGGTRTVVTRQPVGVCLLITPWNFPAAMLTRKLGPALAAGCTSLVKPAGETPLTALLLAELLAEAGVPDGVVNLLPTSRSSDVSKVAMSDSRLRKISFTGSTEVGRVLLKQAADQVLVSSMELGGNAPFVVCADADLDAAVEGAMLAKLRNGGEACTAANRFYVEAPVAEEFGRKLAEKMGAIKVGRGDEDGVGLGPLVNEDTVEKVERIVRETVAAGARTVIGGERPDGPGWFYPPTVLLDVPAGSPATEEEIFGPVAPIVPFETDDEVLANANGTEYGLVAYVYTGDLARGLRLSEALEFGMVGLNRGVVSDPAAPFGGVKQSGIGREGGHEGIAEYLQAKYISFPL
ncbi:NAD-dependent succinate-semialdehyde dehydrogenase [Petropleomorpha daqingensis]|uniref:Succinate-semialdehyde dehydrogenase/glutarate-semialdehyde dehydrogenase n=1 Tax=Petropleomorpha daqingensis TaxID=2026353 RepID=A0A853CFF5_9ACTN|nr:NAD-dependent succinate-semialdehyde dehydrogenase [Petropleomorpha daqingensis]NYJ05906.1 succinate-semialdehyde dehydrogenase/glutarate-semialdehyde dehydrogenase [Petropleomorpha daqingensis]